MEQKNKPKMKYSKIVITSLLITVVVFTIVMIVIFCRMGSVPDSLIAAFYAFAGGEAGILGLIKHGETKYSDYELFDTDDQG